MKKRLLSLLLTACMVLSLLPATALAAEDTDPASGEETSGVETLAAGTGIWVGTTEVTDENATGITGTGITGTVTYDSVNNILTLNGATITSIQPPNQNGNTIGNTGGIFRNTGDLNIKLVGNNSVDVSTATEHYRPRGITTLVGNVTITGDSLSDTLTVTGAPSSQYSVGISTSGVGEVTIKTCTVTATAGDSSATTDYGSPCNGISGSNVTIQDATVTAISGKSPTSSGGIVASGTSGIITIENSTVTASIAPKDAVAGSKALYVAASPILTGVTATASTEVDGTDAVPYAYKDNATYKWFHTVPKADDVAELTPAGSGTVTAYDTVGKAFAAAATTGGTIKLVADVIENVTATDNQDNDKDYTLDLNGKTLDGGNTTSPGITHWGTGTLTIKDSGSGGKVTGKNDYTIHVVDSGTVTVSGGVVENTGTGGVAAIRTYAGTVNIAGGTISCTSANGMAISSPYSQAIINVSGAATIKSNNKAMDKAPVMTGVAAKASVNFNGNSLVDYNPDQLTSYKYIKFTPVAPITTTAIAGVTAPVTGGTPVAEIKGNVQYTGTVAWSGNPSTFANDTVYTATITISPKFGYTLTGVAANSFTVAGATATNSADSGVVTAVFPQTGPMPTRYGIWVGTTEVTDENATGITGTGITGTVTYDSVNNILTLNDASITSIQPPDKIENNFGNTGGIFRSSGNLNIKLIGSNSVDISGATGHSRPSGINSLAGNITITGGSLSDTLTVTGAPSSEYSVGINAPGYSDGQGEVTIKTCTVTATAGNSSATTDYGTYCNGIGGSNVTIQDATVTAISGKSPISSGGIVTYITSDPPGIITIENSTVTASIAPEDAVAGSKALYVAASPTLKGVAATASTAVNGTGAVPYAYKDNDSYKWFHTVPKTDDVAELTPAGSGAVTTYDTVGKAFDAAAATGGTIKLLADVVENVTATITDNDKDYTLDLNGKTLDGGNTTSRAIGHWGTGTLTIKDSGSGGKVTSENGGAIYAGDSGTVTISGGVVESTGTGGGAAIHSFLGIVNITGGTISCASTANAAIIVQNNQATINVSGAATVKGSSRAMNKEPVMTGVAAEASANFDGSELGNYLYWIYGSYKYIVFTPVEPISIAAIEGVTPPVALATAVKTITECDQYTGTVEWANVHEVFGYDAVYTATITITVKPGFTLDGVAADFFTVAGATTVTNPAEFGAITAVFPNTGPKPKYYAIWVGTTEVTSANVGGITGEGIAGTVTYDKATNTLTLNGATITSAKDGFGNGSYFDETGGIFRNSGDLNINLVGNNTVDISSVTDLYRPHGICAADGSLTISGNSLADTLTVTSATASWYSTGIKAGGNINIKNCTVTANAGDVTNTEAGANPSFGITTNTSRENTLTIENATVTAVGATTPGSSTGIHSRCDLNIINSTVFATGNTYAVEAPWSSITMNGVQAKYKIDGDYTGETNVQWSGDARATFFYEGSTSATVAKDVKISPAAVIAIPAIVGVTAPVTGEIPVTTITENDQYTGTVTWSPTVLNNKFAPGTAYTATITLTPKLDYIITGVAEDFFTVAGATATNSANSGVITAEFPATDVAVISCADIAGVTPPVTRATPVKTITTNEQYTVTVAWSGKPNSFAPGTAYTATITLTPKVGYILTGVTENFFKVAGATTVTNSAGDGVVTAVFPATDVAVIYRAAIGNVCPLAGEAPATGIFSDNQYTGTVTWSPAVQNDKFAPFTVYTATITITPKFGYTLDGVAADFFEVYGAQTATNSANSGVVTAVFPKTGAAPIITHTVTFYSDGGSEVSPISGIVSGSTIVLPTAPTMHGFDFSGWVDENLTAFTASTPVTASISVYATWTEKGTTTAGRIVLNGTVSGTVGTPLPAGTTITATLSGDQFQWENFQLTDVTTMFRNIPAGLTATISNVKSTSALVTFTGTPRAAQSGAMTAYVPANAGHLIVLKSGVDIPAGNITGGTWNIAARTITITITTQPKDATVVWQTSATVSVAASITDGTPTYQWYKSDSYATTGGTLIPGATGASYTLPTSVKGEFYYYCVVSGNTAEPVTSAAAKITVKGTISGTTVNGAVKQGKEDLTGTPIAGATVTLTPAVGTTAQTTNAQGEFSFANLPDGSYTLTATKDGKVLTMSLTVTDGEYSPKPASMIFPFANTITITTQPKDQLITTENTAAFSITATATGDVVSYQWYSNSANSTADSTQLEGETSATLTVAKGQPVGEHYYYCVVQSTGATDVTSNLAKLTVSKAPVNKGDIGGDISDDSDNKVSGVSVKLMKFGTDGTQFGQTVITDANGKYGFTDIPYGSYSLVATKGEQTVTKQITVMVLSTTQNLKLLNGTTSTKVEIKAETPSAAAVGLENMFTSDDSALITNQLNAKVEIKLVVEKQDNPADKAIVDAAKPANTKIGLYLDAKLLKTISGSLTDNVTDKPIQPPANQKVTVVLDVPEALQGKQNYSVITVHGGVAKTLSATYDKAMQTLTFQAEQFSTFAITYEEQTVTPPYSGGGSTTGKTELKPGEGGTVTISPTDPKPGNKVTITPVPDEGYQVKDVTVTDKNNQPIKVTDNGDGSYSYIQPSGDVTITVTFEKSGVTEKTTEVTKDEYDKITTAVIDRADGSFYHAPTRLWTKDGKYYATVTLLAEKEYRFIFADEQFADATGTWYEKTANEMASRQMLKGYPDRLFHGTDSITRAEFAALIVRALGLDEQVSTAAAAFTDVAADAWYYGAVGMAFEHGIVLGKGNAIFDPMANITRQEAMQMIYNAAKRVGFGGTTGTAEGFSDLAAVAAWAQAAVDFNAASGIIVGADGELSPTANISRAETATAVLRLLQKTDLVDVR